MSTIVEAPPTPEVTPPVTPEVAPEPLIAPTLPMPAGWRESLPDDLKAEKSLESFKDIPALAKAFVETKKLVGQPRVKPPTDASTPEELSAWRKALNIPEDAAGYLSVGVKVPEAVASMWDEAEGGAFLKTMHAVHAPPGVVQAALNYEAERVAAEHNAAVKARQGAAAELRREWGPTYDANLGHANRAITEFGGNEAVTFLNETRLRDGSVLADHPILVKAFSKIGNALVESGAMQAGNTTTMTADEARQQVAAKRDELKKLPEGHSRKPQIIDEMLALQRVIDKAR